MAWSPDWFSAAVALGSAVIGTGLGAVPAFMLARRASKEVLTRDRVSRTEQERAVGLRVQIKLGIIVNSLLTVRRQLAEAIADPPGDGVELWQCVQPIIGFAGEERVMFEAEEAALFLAAGAGEYAEAMQLLARRHAVQAEVLKEFGARKAELRAMMPAPALINGTTASFHLEAADYMRVRPVMIDLNSMLEQLVAHLEEDVELALALARDYGLILRAHFKDPEYPAFQVPDEESSLMAVRPYVSRSNPSAA